MKKSVAQLDSTDMFIPYDCISSNIESTNDSSSVQDRPRDPSVLYQKIIISTLHINDWLIEHLYFVISDKVHKMGQHATGNKTNNKLYA